MSAKIQKPGEFIDDVRFRVFKERFSRKSILPKYFAGLLVITVLVMLSERRAFFRNTKITSGKMLSYYLPSENIGSTTDIREVETFFQTDAGDTIYLGRKVNTSYLVVKDTTEVKIIYRTDYPRCADIYSTGFWLFPLFQAAWWSIFWFAFAFVYWGYND